MTCESVDEIPKKSYNLIAQMKAGEEFLPMLLYSVVERTLSHLSITEMLKCDIQRRTAEQHFLCYCLPCA